MQPKYIDPPKTIHRQVDAETARYTRMLREGEELAQQRLASFDRDLLMARTIFRRRLGLGVVALVACAAGIAKIALTWNTLWAGVAVSLLAAVGVSSLVVCLFWASEVE